MRYVRHICQLYRRTLAGLPIYFPAFLTSFFFLFIVPTPTDAQVVTVPNATSVAEDQDFAFGYGLYKDNLFQQAFDQLATFLEKYPNSTRRGEAEFLAIDCRYQLEQYADVVRLLRRYVSDYPATQLTDDAYFRLGEAELKLKNYAEAGTAFKSVLANFGDRPLAGEAAYWIGEVSVRVEDYETALKYYTLAYEHYPDNRLRDYAVYSVAWTYQQKHDYVRAVEWYERLKKEFATSSLVSASVVRMGECYFYARDYEKSISVLLEARAGIKDPEEQADSDYLIAEGYYHLGQYSEAQQRYQVFLATHPGHNLEREVTYALGWSLMKQNQFAEASDVFGRLTTGDDGLAHAGLYRRGVAMKSAGDTANASRVFREIVSRWPHGEYTDNALYDLGTLLHEAKEYGSARANFETIIATFPTSELLAEALRMAGECLLSEGRYEQALVMFENALKQPNVAPEVSMGAGYQVAWTLCKLGRFREAAERFGVFVQNFPNHPLKPDASFWRGEAYYRSGNFTGAIASYQVVANMAGHDRHEEALYGIAWSHYKLNDVPKARAGFERLLAAFPSGRFAFDARTRVADCFFALKEYKKAAASYRAVIRQFPTHNGVDYAYYQLGQTSLKDGDTASATQQFSALIRLFSTSPLAADAQYARGWIHFQNKSYGDAIREFQKVMAQFPTSDIVPKAWYSIGDSYYNLQNFAEAEKAYRQVVERFPKSPMVVDALSGIQYCLSAQGKQEEVRHVVDRYIESNPDSPLMEELQLKKAETLYGQKQYNDALREFQSYVARFPTSTNLAAALFWSAKCFSALHRLDEAAAAFERSAAAVGVVPQLAANALLEAGMVYFRQKQYDRAVKHFSTLETRFPSSDATPEASYMKGHIFLENGDQQEAKNQFEFVVHRYPTSIPAARSTLALAEIQLASGDTKSAESMAQRVATTRNDEIGAEAQYFVASIYARGGHWKNAVAAYQRLRYVFPTYEQWVTKAYVGLGVAYENLNDFAKAKDAYQHALVVKRDEPSVAEARRRLNELERK